MLSTFKGAVIEKRTPLIESLIEKGKTLCSTNPFYENLARIFLFMTGPKGVNINSVSTTDLTVTHTTQALYKLIQDITKTELDFKAYTIFKEYGMRLYYEHLRLLFHHGDSNIDVVMALIGLIKTNYDSDRVVIEPIVDWAETHTEQIQEDYLFLSHSNVDKVDIRSSVEKARYHFESARRLTKEAEEHREKGEKIVLGLLGDEI